MAKLNKMQAQATINKLGREYNQLRNKLIEKEEQQHEDSDKLKALCQILDDRNYHQSMAESCGKAVMTMAGHANLTGVYLYSNSKEVYEKFRNKEIQDKYPKIDLDAALDDLIIESVNDDFNIDNFIEHYLKQLNNE